VLEELAERCIVLVNETFFRDCSGGLEGLSVSAGVALVKPMDDVDSLVARADRRMYETKKAGAERRSPSPVEAHAEADAASA